MNNKKQMPITNIGSVSLIMIFIVVCMVTFTVLSLSEATRDYSFSKKLQQHNDDYYAASNAANIMLASLAEDIGNINVSGGEWTVQAYEAVAGLENAEVIYDGESGRPSRGVFTVPMNETQGIKVTIVLEEPGSGSGSIRIAGWQEIELNEWKGDNSINLIR